MSAFDQPQAGDVFTGVGMAFEAQVRAAFSRLPRKLKLSSVHVIPSQGAAVTWFPGVPAVRMAATPKGAPTASYSVELHLPAVNPEDQMSRREASIFAGYAVHELCHVLHTDLKIFQNYAARGSMHRHTLNALEDARIERRTIEERTIPGARKLLLPLSQYIVDKNGADFSEAIKAGRLGAMPLLLALACREYALPDVDAVAALATGRMAEALRLGLAGVQTATCTADLVSYADAILALWPSAPAEAPKPGPGEAGEDAPQGPQDDAGDDDGADDTDDGEDADGDAGDASGGEGDGSEEGEEGDGGAGPEADAGADGADGEGEEVDGDANDTLTDGSGGSAAGKGGADSDDWESAGAEIDAGAFDPEPAEAANDLAKEVSGENAQSWAGEMTAHCSPLAWKKLPSASSNPEDVAKWTRRALEAAKASPVTRAKLARALRSPRVSWASRKLQAGRLDASRLARVGCDDSSVFIRRGETQGTETALTVLVDASGSMSGNNARHAAAAAYGLASVFTAMRLPCEVALFKDGADGSAIYVAKERDAPLRKTSGRIAEMANRANGGTPDTEAMVAYVRRMARWIEARRVLLVITDGVGSASQEQHDRALQEARRAGVQIIGVGIGVHVGALEARYPDCHVAVDSLAELAEALARVLLKAATDWENQRRAAA